MKNLAFYTSLLLLSNLVMGQVTGKLYDFNNGNSSGWGSGSSILTEGYENNAIKIVSNGAGPNLESSYFLFSSPAELNLNSNPYVSLKIKSTSPISVRIDLIDASGYVTNFQPIIREIKDINTFTPLSFNYNGLMKQKTPNAVNLNGTKIIGINVYINPGASSFKGTIYLDDLAFGTAADRSVGNGIPGIKVSQIGFYPEGKKYAIASSTSKTTFKLVDESNKTVYTGNLGELRSFEAAKDSTKIADFSNFKTLGKYKVVVDGTPNSVFFEIKNKIHYDLSKASIKYYYFNRLSIPIEKEYAGIWNRLSGHPDDKVYIHRSAATELRPEGTLVSAPRGWYDAGDYNKYVINSGISTFTLMALYERFWPMYDTLDLNIPESNNNVPDLLDEIKWNLDWMINMQDPDDGGVYFKLTSKGFTPDFMPSEDKTDRYMVGKSTSSALNYAATMAMAYRIYKPFDTEFGSFADTCLVRAYKAYLWAKANPNIAFNNPSDISTGGYGDSNFKDEFFWAACELYISSKDDTFYEDIKFTFTPNVPGWNATYALGLMSLSHNADYLTDLADKTQIIDKMKAAVSGMINKYNSTAYLMAMNSTNFDYYWGSNSVAANQSMILLQDYFNTGNEVSYDAANGNLEYLLGKNPLEICFVTGFGTKSPKSPHHRQSMGDGVVPPVPGMLVGGPNLNSANESGCEYQYNLAALEYTDQSCSYSTNEIAINWNAPLAFTLGAIEAKQLGLSPSYKFFPKGYPMGLSKKISNSDLKVYPVPASELVYFELSNEYEIESVNLLDLNGNIIIQDLKEKEINVSTLNNALYLLQIQTNKGLISQKISVLK